MPRTNRQADLSRQEANPNRRTTRSSTRRAEPPLVIAEPQNEQPRASTRQKRAAQKRKGKAKAVETQNSDSEDETLQNVLFESRQMAENEARWFEHQRGEPSTRGADEDDDGPLLDDPSDSEAWYDDERLERDYLDTGNKRKLFYELLRIGHTRMQAYMYVERRLRRMRERHVRSKLIEEDASEAFRKNGFEGTYYPHFPTLSELGLQEDFAHLAHSCGLERFLERKDDTFVDETIDFLCTVCVHVYDPRIIALHQFSGGGYITFTVKGQDYTCTLKEIQELFGFRVGFTRRAEVQRAEINAVWRLLTGRLVFAGSNDKGNWIRNPAISYFRRAVANTLYARDTTGNVNIGEAEILVEVVRRISRFAYRQELIGDTENSGFAFILACHLMEYRTRAITQAKSTGTKKRKCSIGGVVCAILRKVGIRFAEYQVDGKENDIGHRVMDIDYLQRAAMLHKGSKTVHLYKFIHPQRENAYIRLPREDLVRLRFDDRYRNAEFVPALEELAEPAGRLRLPAPEAEPEAAGPEADEEEAAEPVSTTARRGRTSSRRIDQRLNLLARMQKSMLKSFNKFVRKGKDHEKRISELEAENREFRARLSTGDDRGTSAPYAHHISPNRQSYAGTEHYHGGEQGGTSHDPENSGDDSP